MSAPSSAPLPSGPGPPSYAEARRTSCMPAGVTCIDFAPRCVDDGGILTSVKYERFDLLVARANTWLRAHPCIGVKCCETVEYGSNVCKYGAAVDTSAMLASGGQKAAAFTFLVLRLWVYIKEESSAHQLAYLNVVPACLHPGGVFSKPRFDLLHNVVCKLNVMLKRRPVPGRILNIDTVCTRLRQYSEWVEPDRCHWRHHSGVGVAILTFLRVFYQPGEGKQLYGTLRFRDFPPLFQQTQGSSMIYETQEGVMSRLGAWLTANSPGQVLNLETVTRTVKMVKGKCHLDEVINTLGSLWKPSPQARVIRLWHVERERTPDILPINSPVPPPVQHLQDTLLSRDFFPPSNPSRSRHMVEYDCLVETLATLERWQQERSDVRVQGVETCYVGLDTNLQRPPTTSPSAATYTTTEESHTVLAFIRVFYYIA